MRRNARIDVNQPEIVAAVRKMGCTVQHLHTIGQGCPDILVGVSGINLLWEIKDGEKPPSGQRLTVDELFWHEAWRGQVAVVNSIEKAISTINWVRKSHDAR